MPSGWTPTTPNEAAAEWDGGLYRAWTDGTHTAVVLRTVWDSAEDAQEFSDAMQRWTTDATVISLTGSRVDVGFTSDADTLAALRAALGDTA